MIRARLLAIAIRTVVIQGGQIEVTAGAGIVEGSVPEREAEETRNKALAAIRAAQDAALARDAEVGVPRGSEPDPEASR